MEQVELFKTAHLLLVKHGERVIADIEDKIGTYANEHDLEAVDILKRIRFAASSLLSVSGDCNVLH